jgi:serine/threonine protein kinase
MQKRFNQYYITEQISSKPLRSVYLAHHARDTSHKVLLKIFDATCLALGQESERFLHQVECIKQLRHTHIVPILDLGVEQGQPYIVSQYLSGGSLRQYLDGIAPQRLSLQEALKIISQLGQALSYLHEHAYLHENVKPENVFFNEKGEVLLADFRLAGFLDVTQLGYQSDPRTMCYMAPEQFAGSASQQSDQYALACLAYELIAGRMPFSAQSYAMMWASHYAQALVPLSNLVPDVPEQIEKALCKAMAKEPSERYANISTFLLALEDAAFSPTWPISRPLSLSTLDSFSASLEVPLGNMVNNAPIEPTVAHSSYEEQQADISYEGTLASAPFGANLSDISFSMSLVGTPYGISMAGVPYGTSLAGNPFEKGITAAIKSIQSDAPEEDLEEIQFETSLSRDPSGEDLTEISFENIQADGSFEMPLGRDLFKSVLLRWLGRLRDSVRSCLSTVQVISRRGLLLLSKQGMHLFEHWERIVSRLRADRARTTEAPILWLVLVSTMFVLVGGIVSDIWLASHASGVIQSSNVGKTAIKTKNIMPINIKLIARPVADPTVMSAPQGSTSSSASPSAFVVQPTQTPSSSSNRVEQMLQQITRFQRAASL